MVKKFRFTGDPIADLPDLSGKGEVFLTNEYRERLWKRRIAQEKKEVQLRGIQETP